MSRAWCKFLPCVVALLLIVGCSERSAQQEYAALLDKEMSDGDSEQLSKQYAELITRYPDTEIATRARERLIALRDKHRESLAREELRADWETKQSQSQTAEQRHRTEQDQRLTQLKADVDASLRQLKADLETSQRELAAQFDRKLREAQSAAALPAESNGSRPATAARVGGSGQPGYVRNPAPVYPREALEHRWEGTTMLRVEVLPDGTPGKIEIAKGSGHDVLDAAAVETVRHWKFSAAGAADSALRSTVEVPVTFRLAQ